MHDNSLPHRLPRVSPEEQRIVLLGAGNVATHLAQALHGLSTSLGRCRITEIYSPSGVSASSLASTLAGEVRSTSQLAELSQDADWYLFAVRDDALPSLWQALAGHTSGIWLHTSGSTPLEAMAAYHQQVGILYPLQTFSKAKTIDFSTIPLYIEAGEGETLSQLTQLAESLSHEVHVATSAQRAILHVAAVFACNFSNHLVALAEELLISHGLPQKALLPLLSETLEKLYTLPASEAQTGPAVRGDRQTLERHLSLLQGRPELESLYRLLSEQIQSRSKLLHP